MKLITGIEIENYNKINILEKIKKNIGVCNDFFHIVSLNPEILIIAQKDRLFREIVVKAQIKIVDGVGVVVAGRMLHGVKYERVTGVELMQDMLKLASQNSLRVMLIGGKENLALELANCYNEKFPTAKFYGMQGIKNIVKPTQEEEERIFSIVKAFKPQFVFVAFGSPYQELWLWKNKAKFKGMVCMGVGGAFDYLSNSVPRAPFILRKAGLEWLFRLIVQPWRIKRQLRLVQFVGLIFKEKMTKAFSKTSG